MTRINPLKAKCPDQTAGWDCSNENIMQSTCLQKCTHENRYATKKCICRKSSTTGNDPIETGGDITKPEVGSLITVFELQKGWKMPLETQGSRMFGRRIRKRCWFNWWFKWRLLWWVKWRRFKRSK